MFKLPQLQPELTGANGVEGINYKRFWKTYPEANSHRFKSKGADIWDKPLSEGSLPLQTQSWNEQASTVMKTIKQQRYASLAIYAEVRLREALKKCQLIQLATQDEQQQKPDRLTTAICCQLLEEFATMCGPLNKIISTLHQQLVYSIYSDLYSMEQGGAQLFEQIPYYCIVDRLKKENELLQKEQEETQQTLAMRQKEFVRIEGQLMNFSSIVQQCEQEQKTMSAELDKVRNKEGRFEIEAETAKQELRQLRKQVFSLQDNLHEITSKYDTETERSSKSINALRGAVHDVKAQLEHCKAELKEKASYISPQQFQDMKEQLEMQTNEVEYLTSFKLQFEQLRQKQGNLTPRPQWEDVNVAVSDFVPPSTENVVQHLLQNYRQTESQLKLLNEVYFSWLLPDTFCAYELNFEAVDDLQIEALGVQKAVPKILRWNQPVDLLIWTPEIFETEVDKTVLAWRGSRKHSLFEFLFSRYTEGEGVLDDKIQAVYNLVYWSNQFSEKSFLARTMNDVSNKRLHEHVFHGLYDILSALHQMIEIFTQNLESNQVNVLDTITAIHKMLPCISPVQIDQLQELIEEQNQEFFLNFSDVQELVPGSQNRLVQFVWICFMEQWTGWLKQISQCLLQCFQQGQNFNDNEFVLFIISTLQNEHGLEELEARQLLQNLTGVTNTTQVAQKLKYCQFDQVDLQGQICEYESVLKVQNMLEWCEMACQKNSGSYDSGKLPEMA